MNRVRRWWLRNFVFGRDLYDFAVLTVQRSEAQIKAEQTHADPPTESDGGDA